MKLIHKICLGILIAPISALANEDCSKLKGTHDVCGCLASNAILDCKQSSNNSPECNLKTLNKLAEASQSHIPTLTALCEQFRNKNYPDECVWGVKYYISNQCWNKTIG